MSDAKRLYWVIDDSGSMATFAQPIRIQVEAAVSRMGAAWTHTYVCFANGCRVGRGEIPSFSGGGTEIANGFAKLNELLLQDRPKELIVVFISDGADNNPSTIVQRLKQMGGSTQVAGCSSVLFTVAVGAGFPTQMVVKALRPGYHNGSDYLPLVFPLDHTGEVEVVFEELVSTIVSGDHHATGPPTVGPDSTSVQIKCAATAVYNFAVMRSTCEEDKDKVLAALQAAKEQLEAMGAAVRAREEARGEALAQAKQEDSLKPLASRLLAKYKRERSTDLTLILELITKVNSLVGEATQGKLLSRMSDAELAKALGYGNTAGRYLTKAVKYHGADFGNTMRSLLKYLGEYSTEQAEADEQVSDFLLTQREAIADAKGCMAELEASTLNSVVSLLDVLALVGRTLEVRTCDGTQMNPWLVEVLGMPTIMKHMNSVSFYQQHGGEYVDDAHDERANCLLPVATGPNSILRAYVGQHITTFMLCKNEALIFPDSLAALVAATATFCLARPQPLPQWVQGELDQALATYRAVYGDERGAPGAPVAINRAYWQRLASPGVRTCLQTESLADPCIKCPHLTKFVLALLLDVRAKAAAAAAAAAAKAAEAGQEEGVEGGEEGAVPATGSPAAAPKRPHSANNKYAGGAGGKGPNKSPPAKAKEGEEGQVPYTSARLREMMVWFVVEMVGRGIDRSKPLLAHLPPCRMKTPVGALLAAVDMEPALGEYTLPQALDRFSADVEAAVVGEDPRLGPACPVEEYVASVASLGVTHHQFSESAVCLLFASLDRLAGNPDLGPAFFHLTPAERVAVLNCALNTPTSAARCNLPGLEPLDPQELHKMIVGAHVRAVRDAAPAALKAAYTRRVISQHLGEATAFFPQALTARFKADTGHDLDALLGINPDTRLPRFACCHRTCPSFLKLCPLSVDKEGRPRMSDALMSHLEPMGVPTGLTRVNRALAGASLEEVARKVMDASELLPAEPARRTRAVSSVAKWLANVRSAALAQPQGAAAAEEAGVAGEQGQGAEETLLKVMVEQLRQDREQGEQGEEAWGGYEAFRERMAAWCAANAEAATTAAARVAAGAPGGA